MQAVILAAGMGKRLKDLTKNNTKCMIEVNGVTLINRMLNQLDKLDLDRIVIVVGYMKDNLMEYISTLNIKTKIIFIENNVYDTTNNIYSLSLAESYLKTDDTLLLESDLIFEDSILTDLINDPRPSLAVVNKFEPWMDGTCFKLDDNDNIKYFISKEQFKYSEIDEYYKTVNIYKFSKTFLQDSYLPFLIAYRSVLGDSNYYENVLKVLCFADENFDLKAKRISDKSWYEIDDIQDLNIAESIFSENSFNLINKRYGGFWRYPKLLDFCYLVNPYYPPQKLIDEMNANFYNLITQYPSGMDVISLLASKNFMVEKSKIIIGNGAAELINLLMKQLVGKIGIIRPTFEEYPNRIKNEMVVFNPSYNKHFKYTEDDLINYFSVHKINNLILINPDNPSGNFIDKKGFLKLLEWAKINSITLIVDESFVDFANDDFSVLNNDILNNYKNLIVVKSISKAYGVPGLRLGVLASGNLSIIEELKKSISIWNINSFAEFYMQIMEKYNKFYVEALTKFKTERARFKEELEKINGLTVFSSQSNYFMIELNAGISSNDICDILLKKYNILLKDLSTKINYNNKQFLRIAIKKKEENQYLCEALTAILNEL